MKVKRMIKSDVDTFKVGDIIKVKLTDGVKVQAMAMQQEEDGMIFCLVDCLPGEYPMNSTRTNEGGYEESDLRKKLNTEAAQRREAYEKQAEKEKEQLLQDAQRQADAIVAEGKAAAEAEHARRLRDANAETSALARDMCEKLLARNLTQQDDARLLDDLLQKAGDSNGK